MMVNFITDTEHHTTHCNKTVDGAISNESPSHLVECSIPAGCHVFLLGSSLSVAFHSDPPQTHCSYKKINS